MKGLFGGSSQKSTSTSDSRSWNNSYPFIQDTFGGTAKATGGAMGTIGALLGIGNDEQAAARQMEAFDNFRNSSGYNFIKEQGVNALTSSMGAKGLLNSGATGKALMKYGSNLADTTLQKYLDNTFNYGKMGLDAGSLIANAGQESTSKSTSTSKGSSKPGISKFLGAGLSAVAASDPRLKMDVVKIGELKDGLGVYEFAYIWDENERHVGVMADEVEELRPWALGPELDGGFKTVDYGRL